MKIIYIKWLDAAKQPKEGLELEDILSSPMIIHTAGILISDKNKTYTIAMAHTESNKDYDFIYHIPFKYVLEKKIWTVKKTSLGI